MSHVRLKTTYNEEGSYGSVDQYVLYAHHNNSSDYVTFYDEKGNVILVVPDTLDNNLLDAINRLYAPNKEGLHHNGLIDKVEYMDKNDREICGL